MKSKELRKAEKYHRRKQYGRVITFLEPQVFMFRDNSQYYRLVGSSCYFTGDYGGCYSYVKRALDIDADDIYSRLFLAAVYLKRRESDKAIREWLGILDREPRNRYARDGLEFLRRLDTIEELRERLTPKQLKKFVPVPFSMPWRIPFSAASVAAVIVILVYLFPQLDFDRYFDSPSDRDGVETIAFPQGQPLTSLEGDHQYVLSEREIEEILDRIRYYFNSHRDNMVRREVNRLLLSTATAPVKERVRLLQQTLKAPDFTNMQDSFAYQDVRQSLALYAGTYVRWKGRATNVVRHDDTVQFTLLVGYHTGTVLEGSVPVNVPFAADVRTDMGVELIAQVQIPDHDSDNRLTGSPFHLNAETLRFFQMDSN